jgi:hypothetical protein
MSRLEYTPNPPPQTLTDPSSKDLALYLQNELTQISNFIGELSGGKNQVGAWGVFDHLAVISDSLNIKSVTTSSTGIYDVLFSVPLSTTNYCIVASASNYPGLVMRSVGYSSKTINGFTLYIRDDTGAYTTATQTSFSILGGE